MSSKIFVFTLFVFAFSTAFYSAHLYAADSDSHSSATKSEIFLMLTSADSETQMMALILVTQAVNQGGKARILLCGEAGNLGVQNNESPSFRPLDRSPSQLLSGLINQDVVVEVCGIFLPNRPDLSSDDLLDGVVTARPPDVAAYMLQNHVRFLSF
ncbi:MAG: hypothetical protein LAT67_13285 [Balneolales bacterium]|nr:hypothetical protein [Balneolales bacterium]